MTTERTPAVYTVTPYRGRSLQESARSSLPDDPFLQEHGGEDLPILTAAEFLAQFKPPSYLLDGILQRGYLYSLTARTHHGKTAVSMCAVKSIMLGLSLGGRKVQQGSVLFLAGENPDDVLYRFMAMAHDHGFNLGEMPLLVIPKVIDIRTYLAKLHDHAEAIGGFALVVIDTAAAYFPGEDIKENVQQGAYARLLRELTKLPGNPTVLVNSHPVKNAAKDNLLPAGGGAFLNEMDGNLTLWSTAEGATTLHWQGKFRGPQFEPMSFELSTVTAPMLADAHGRLIPSVVARPLSVAQVEQLERERERAEDKLLAIIGHNPRASIRDMAKKGEWVSDRGMEQTSTVHRLLQSLLSDKLIEKFGRQYRITAAGKRALKWDESDD